MAGSPPGARAMLPAPSTAWPATASSPRPRARTHLTCSPPSTGGCRALPVASGARRVPLHRARLRTNHAPRGITCDLRITFGTGTLAVLPATRRTIDRSDWPRSARLGVTWVAHPALDASAPLSATCRPLSRGRRTAPTNCFTAFVATLTPGKLPPRATAHRPGHSDRGRGARRARHRWAMKAARLGRDRPDSSSPSAPTASPTTCSVPTPAALRRAPRDLASHSQLGFVLTLPLWASLLVPSSSFAWRPLLAALLWAPWATGSGLCGDGDAHRRESAARSSLASRPMQFPWSRIILGAVFRNDHIAPSADRRHRSRAGGRLASPAVPEPAAISGTVGQDGDVARLGDPFGGRPRVQTPRWLLDRSRCHCRDRRLRVGRSSALGDRSAHRVAADFARGPDPDDQTHRVTTPTSRRCPTRRGRQLDAVHHDGVAARRRATRPPSPPTTTTYRWAAASRDRPPTAARRMTIAAALGDEDRAGHRSLAVRRLPRRRRQLPRPHLRRRARPQRVAPTVPTSPTTSSNAIPPDHDPDGEPRRRRRRSRCRRLPGGHGAPRRRCSPAADRRFEPRSPRQVVAPAMGGMVVGIDRRRSRADATRTGVRRSPIDLPAA